MSFDMKCDLSDLIHHSNHCHKGHHCINARSCYRGPVCSQKVGKIAEVMCGDCGGYAYGAMAIRAPSELKTTEIFIFIQCFVMMPLVLAFLLNILSVIHM